jgi:hypothetical protein
MNNKKLALSITFVFAYLYLIDFLLNSMFLKEAYEGTSNLWRSDLEIVGFTHLCIIAHLVFSIILVQFFRDFVLHKRRPMLHDSLAAGLLIGEMVGIVQLATYIYMPITPAIAISWFTARVIQCVGSAYIVHSIDQNIK